MMSHVDLPGLVIDSSVFVSALRSKRGASYRLVTLIGKGRFEIDLSVPRALEYESAGRRALPSTTLTAVDFDAILDFVVQSARLREIYFNWRPSLPDPGDDMVLELAVASGGSKIVTFNRSDFRGSEAFGVSIVTPREVLVELGEVQP